MKNMKKVAIHTLLLLSSLCSLIATAQVQFRAPLTPVDPKGNAIEPNQINGDVFFVRDADGKPFLAKRHENSTYAIPELIATMIGEQMGLNINHIELLDENSKPIKNQYPTTLHTIVPGSMLWEQQDLDQKINIIGGLTQDVNFETLLQFPELATAVAFDIFTNNWDRHNGNIFFDPRTQKFYLIDMDYSFITIQRAPFTGEFCRGIHQWPNLICDASMALNSQQFLKQLFASNNPTTKKLAILKQINEMLTKMINAYPPSKLYTMWMDCARKMNQSYTIAEKVRIRTMLSNHYYMVRLAQAQINILTNNEKDAESYFSKDNAIIFTGEKLAATQRKALILGRDIQKVAINLPSMLNHAKIRIKNLFLPQQQKDNELQAANS